MPRKRQLLVNPVLCQYVYDVLLTTTPHERLNLSGKYLKAAKHSKTALTFAVNSTYEEKAILLAKLGKPFFWGVGIDREGLKKLMDENIFGQKELTDRAIKDRFVVVADKQFIQFAGLLAASCHGETWMLNRQFLTVGYRMKEWRKEYANTTHSEMKASRQASKDIAKLQVHTLMLSEMVPEICGITKPALDVLLWMFAREREFISLLNLKTVFSGIHRNFKVLSAVTQLRESLYIEKSMLSKDIEYRVTALGADAVMKFQKRVLNAENF